MDTSDKRCVAAVFEKKKRCIDETSAAGMRKKGQKRGKRASKVEDSAKEAREKEGWGRCR